VILDDNCSYHWDSGDELADAHKHSAFDIYCHYEHGGNAKAAVKAYMLETGHIQEPDFVNGVACCPIHHVKLPRAANGNGYKCHQKDGSEWCSYYWKGEGYVMPDSKTPANSNESRPTLKLTPEDVVTARVQPPINRFVLHSRFDLNAIHDPEWLLDGEIVARGYNMIYGPSGSGKTFYLVDVLRRASAIGFVVYVATENTAGLKVRVIAQEKAHGIVLENFGWFDQDIDLTNMRDVDDLIALLAPFAPVLVIIDTLAMSHSGDENSNQDMGVVNHAVQRLIKELNTAVVLVHHTGVNEGRERGATSLMGNLDLKIKVTMDDDLITIAQEKVRHGEIGDPRKFRLTKVDTGLLDKHGSPIVSAVIRPSADVSNRGAKLTARQKMILVTLGQEVFRIAGAKGAQLMGAHKEIPQSSFYGLMSKLIRLELVRQGGKGDPFYITEKGRDEIAPDYLELPDNSYTPAGYEGDSNNADRSVMPDSNDSRATPSDSHNTIESSSTTTLDSSTPTLISFRNESGENLESDQREEMEEQNNDQQIANPYSDVDLDYVRTLYANKELVAIQRHCALRSFNGIRPASVEAVLEFIDPQPLFDEDG
jgi:hypothetical protein